MQECLDSLLGQSRPPDAVFIVDNHSTDGTYDHLLGRGLISAVGDSQGIGRTVRSVPVPGHGDRRLDVHYVRLSENSGGAGGFHEGMKQAIEAGFDWLWLMDDDVLVAPDALAVLVEKRTRSRPRETNRFC